MSATFSRLARTVRNARRSARTSRPAKRLFGRLEALELRQMMAADFTSAMSATLFDAPATSAPEMSVATVGTITPSQLASSSSLRTSGVAPMNADDTFDSARDLGVLAGGTTIRDWVGLADQGDYLRFTLTEATEVGLHLDRLSADVDLYLYDSAGNEITRSWLGGTADEHIVTPLAAGTYFVAVRPWNSAESTYRLSLATDGADETMDAARDLGVVAGPQEIVDWAGNYDQDDFYRFVVNDPSQVTVRLEGLADDVDLFLLDANGNEISRSWLGGSASEFISQELAVGTYYLAVRPWGAAQSNYRLILDGDAAGNDLGSARDLGRFHGVREITDWVGVTDPGDYYRFVVDDLAQVSLSLDQLSQDIDLYLYDAYGNEITRSWLGGNENESIVVDLAAGEYFVAVDPWLEAASNFHLTVDVDVAGEEMAAARDLGQFVGSLNLTDMVGFADPEDYFRFELTGTSDVSLRLRELGADVDLYLYDAAGNEITRSWAGGSTDEMIAMQLPAGTYFARVAPWNGAESDYRFTLNVNPTGSDDWFGGALDLGLISRLDDLYGHVGQGDPNDFFRFSLNQQSIVTWQLDQLAADIDLYLYDAAGNELTRSWLGGTESELIQADLGAGTYYMRVTPWDAADSNYHLSWNAVGVGDPGDPGDPTDPGDAFPDVPTFGGANDWNLNSVNAPEVWAQGYTGAGVIVAVVDTGVDYFHTELAGSMWTNGGELAGNGLDDDGNGFVDDVRGWDFISGDNTPYDENEHGTHVAGTIAAAHDGVGANGVAYGATIMPVRVLDGDGSGSYEGVAAGIRYAVDNGAQIINLSLGGGYTSVIASALQYAMDNNVFVAAASGNESASMPGYPARHAAELSNVLSVGAHTSANVRSSFSNRVGLSGAVQIDAPGSDIYSSIPNGGYDHFNGTSMATPHVAAVAALTLSANPNLTAAQLRQLLVDGANRTIVGSDSRGGVNAALTVAMAVGYQPAAAPLALQAAFAAEGDDVGGMSMASASAKSGNGWFLADGGDDAPAADETLRDECFACDALLPSGSLGPQIAAASAATESELAFDDAEDDAADAAFGDLASELTGFGALATLVA